MPIRRKQTPKGLRARRRILDAAEDLFSSRGFYGASIREVATAADMPTASLLHHFPTKEALYRELLDRIAADLENCLAGAMSAGVPDDRSALRELCRSYLDWTAEKPHYSRLLVRELLDNPSRVREAGHLSMRAVVDLVTRFIEGGVERGSFRPVDPLVFIAHLAGSASYFSAALPTFARLVDSDDATALADDYRVDFSRLMEKALIADSGGEIQ